MAAFGQPPRHRHLAESSCTDGRGGLGGPGGLAVWRSGGPLVGVLMSSVQRWLSAAQCSVPPSNITSVLGVVHPPLHQCGCAWHYDEVDAGAEDEDLGDSAEVDADGGAHMCYHVRRN